MDIKSLHQAIQELRAELNWVNLAIQRIEVIAADVGREQQTGNDSSELNPQIDAPARAAD